MSVADPSKARLLAENEALRKALAEAQDQQTATSSILRAINGAQTNAQPVFEAIARNAVRLCGALRCHVFRFDGTLIHIAADYNLQPEAEEFFRHAFPSPPTSDSVLGLAIRERRAVQQAEAQTNPALPARQREMARRLGYQSLLAVPMLLDNTVIGAIGVSRREPHPFSEEQIALLQTFADQAVIAIENARLLTELQTSNRELSDSLERQTATSEILSVISSSPTAIQPTFAAIVRAATTLCEGHMGYLFSFDGELIRVAAQHGGTAAEIDATSQAFPQSPSRDSATARAVLTRAVVQIDDASADSQVAGPLRVFRTVLSVPMLRDTQALGTITVVRRVVQPFSDKQIALLKTFADQAVIAIENVRLFTELQTSNRELTTALETQTATSDILRVISRSQTDVQPVFDAIVTSAVRLLRAHTGLITRVVGKQIELAALISNDEAGDAAARAGFPVPIDSDGATAQALRNRQPLNVVDAETEPRFTDGMRAIARARGYRSLVGVPLPRQEESIGVIAVTRREPGGFTEDEIGLLGTFADQAVIAIENARLLTELQSRTRELEVASQHKSEFLASMSHELRTPLNAVIGFSDVLLQGMFGETNAKQTEYLRDILASGQHLLSLINDILDLSKIEAGRMDLDLADFHLPSAIDDAMLLMRERAGRRGIELERQVDERLGEIRADQRKVKQVLLNLLSNAVKFTPEGGRIDVRAMLVDGAVEVSVTDTGIGIAPEDHEAVFEEFKQVGKADKKAEGTGLGLALCRKFVELHGGRIWVKSEIGAGSTFSFSLPLKKLEPGAGVEPATY